MQIKLALIKPSPKPIRSSWDEEKMNELKWSLMEEGQVEPIGVHENNHGYVVIWGHRRVEAARRAAWTEIEAVVVKQDEVNNLIQAGIENLASEDMTIKDKIDWYRRLIELGETQSSISRRSTVPQNTLSQWQTIIRENAAGVIIAGDKSFSQDEGVRKLVSIKEILGDNLEAKKAVASKVSEDKLTNVQTREVAAAYRDAPTLEIKAAVLRQPIISRDTAADILRRSTNRVELEGHLDSLHEASEFDKEREERRTMQAWDFAVKEFLDATKLYSVTVSKGPALVKYGKYSPEAAQFTIRKIDNLIDALKTYKEALEGIS